MGSLPSSWEPKVIAIEEARYTSTLTMDDLLGSLLTHEIKLKRKDSNELKLKSLALKAKKDNESETSDENEDIALLTKRFNKFIRK